MICLRVYKREQEDHLMKWYEVSGDNVFDYQISFLEVEVKEHFLSDNLVVEVR
jgi:hypothetical protein